MINTPSKCVPLFLHMHFLVWCCYLSVVVFCNMMHACKVHGNIFYCISVPCIIDSVCLCLCYWESSSVSVFQMWSICAPFSRQAQTLRSSPIWRSWTVLRCLCRRYLRGPWSSLEYVSDPEVICSLICSSVHTVVHVFRFLCWKCLDRWPWFSCWRPVCSAWSTTPGAYSFLLITFIHSFLECSGGFKTQLYDSVLF